MRNVSVIGAGTMGNGIAHVFAQNGHQVVLIDVSEAQLQKALKTIQKNLDRQLAKELITAEQKEATLQNIITESRIEKGVDAAQLVVEAATENEALKLELFKKADAAAPKDCILATNTSSISVTRIAAATGRPGQVIGMHFMNPVPVMKLVEVINGYATAQSVTATIVELSRKLGKIPALANDYPGFVANRILMPMINEAIYSLYEGVAGVEAIDIIMKLGMAHPMGPLQLADFIGLDVCLSILNVLYSGFGNPKYAACPLLVNMVASGKLGIKSGEGFYSYTQGSKGLVVSEKFR
ncbi:3-hydroxybutyryl-CoA dehydrogenase [Niabella ginsenosidivorans]|uniref:3-hydroxybutyryl-CoA dehydrogenase n=1 Tax=Niabella ginsenosidivorans TaxID=1176587 RepID=A0A1A9I8L8_9BACT|nr:3-hydroxybutyryl-CoA dehydrogenase [Niabella ginsenosidivorans]